MTERRTLVLDDKDAVLYCTSDPAAMRGTVIRLCEIAKARVALAGPDPVDQDTGEVKPRLWCWVFAQAAVDVTARQRNFLHGVVLKQIADQVRVNGAAFSLQVWKEHYRQKFLGTDGKGNRWVMRQMPGWKKAVPVRERVSTEDLGVKDYSIHIDRVIADAVTEHGVEFQFDLQEREAVRYRAPARKARKAATATA